MESLILGVVLTFAGIDGQSLLLNVALREAAPATLELATRTQTAAAARVHRFGPFPLPFGEAQPYTLRVGGEVRQGSLPAFAKDRIRFAIYGDNRDGDGPHAILTEAILRESPDLVVHTGDIVRDARDEPGWQSFLRALAPVTARAPLVLGLGNHEIWSPSGRDPTLGQEKVLERIPPPPDPDAAGVSPLVYRVRVGPALFIALDSNRALAPGSPQFRYLESVLAAKRDAQHVVVVMHHGPVSSGPHGGHPEGAALPALFSKHGVTLVAQGHDHVYERVERGGVTYVISGGGGSPLYPRVSQETGSAVFASTYHFVIAELNGPELRIEARSLEGVVLDRVTRRVDEAPVAPAVLPAPLPLGRPIWPAVLGLLLVFGLGISWITYRIVRRRLRGQSDES